MDIFTEQLTRKHMRLFDYILIVSIILFIFLEPILMVIFFPVVNYIFILLTMIITGYIGTYVINSRFIEFEYITTNGNFTIDKILSKRRRKNVISFEISDIDNFEIYNKHINLSEYKKIYRVYTQGDVWYATLKDNKGNKIAIIFSPNEKTIEAMKPFLKRQVLIDAFGRN